MSGKQELIAEILDIEWEMFTSVQASGGASCQEDQRSFQVIRTANFLTWSEATLTSYLNDLKTAQARGRNLMTEKYARMEGLIPLLNPAAAPLIDRIVRKECLWAEEYLKGTPGSRLARPIYSHDDTDEITSSETYSRAELDTYSTDTLDFYYSDILGMSARGENRIALSVGYMKAMSSDKDLDWRHFLDSREDR